MRTVLFPITCPWSDLFQAPQQWARQFAKNGWQVFYGEKAPRKRWTLREVEPNIFLIGSYRRFVTGRRFSLKFFGNPRDVKNAAFMKCRAKQCVFNLWDDFPSWRRYEKQAAAVADIRCGVSERLRETRPYIDHVIPNGCDRSWLSLSAPPPVEFQQAGGPVALYVGYYGPWIDFDSIAATAEKMPTFAIGAGPVKLPESVVDLGPKSWADLFAYYQHAALSLAPFLDCDTSRAVSPIKMFESLAAGTPCKVQNVDQRFESAGLSADDCRRLVENETWDNRYRQLADLLDA